MSGTEMLYLPPPKTSPFAGSPVSPAPAGQMGDYLVNTYLLQCNRKRELTGPVTFRASDWDAGKRPF